MKFKILFIFTILICLACSGSVVSAEPVLKVISAKLEKDILKQGETTNITVTIKNVGDSAAYDISFVLSLSNSDIGEINIDGYNRLKDIGVITNYHIDSKKTSLAPGETKTAIYIINAAAPNQEEYILRFVAGGRLGADKVLNKETTWWPKYVYLALKIYLKIELPPEYYFKKAEEYFNSGNYENAKDYSEKAKEIYINYGNNEGALNCNKIILQSEKMPEADLAYIRAKDRMDKGDFKGAISNAEKSIKIYNEIDLIDLVDSGLISDRVPELKSMVERINKTFTAKEYFSNAKRYLDSKDYEKAKEYAEKAKEIYLELDDSVSVLGCNSIIDKSESNINRNAMILKISYAIGIIINLILILIIYKMYR